MKYSMSLVFVMFSITIFGCSQFNRPIGYCPYPNSSLTEIAGSELDHYVGLSDRHILVEFSVEHSCGRCESMKPHLIHLAERYKDSVDFVRVDFANNVELVTKYGGTVCPTYVLFEKKHSEPVFTQSFPISRDVLETELLALLAFD